MIVLCTTKKVKHQKRTMKVSTQPYVEQNQQMADLLRATCAAGDAATKALDAAVRAQMCADKIDDMFHSIRAQLKEIRAKKELGIRLSQKERAIWTLYGEASK